jgi:hypothetical protein
MCIESALGLTVVRGSVVRQESRMKWRRIRRKFAVLGIVLGLGLVWTGVAAAYQIVYYLGSYSNPITVSNGWVGSQTSGTAYRLFNEATAKTSDCGAYPCGYMNTVRLYYNTTLIGQSANTFYYIVYRNGANVHSGCDIYNSWGIGGNYPAWIWCDTTI